MLNSMLQKRLEARIKKCPMSLGPLKEQRVCPHCDAYLYAFQSGFHCCCIMFSKALGEGCAPMKIFPTLAPEILDIFTNKTRSKELHYYNNALSMASIGGEFPNIDATLRLQGKMYHQLGPALESNPGERPQFLSLYYKIYPQK